MKRVLLLVFLIFVSNITGCWDSRELDTLALVMAVGVDRAENSGNFSVTVQIAKPSSQAQGKSASMSDNEAPVWTASAEGKTIFEAIRNLARFSSRRIMWAHNNVVIIGESLARDDITPIIDFFTHNPELRMKTWVAVSHGDAKAYIAAKTGIETIPGISIAELFRYYELSSVSIQTDMEKLFRDFMSDSVQPLVSALHIKKRIIPTGGQEHGGEQQIELAGSAVFKGVKMIGWVSPEESRGLGILKKEIKSAVITVPASEDGNKYVSVEIRGIKVSIESQIIDDIPSLSIKVSGHGNISEQDFSTGILMEDFKRKVEEGISEIIKEEIRIGLDKVQKEFRSDVLAFGRIVHIQHRQDWYAGLKDEWEEIFPDIPVSIHVKIDIHYSSTYQKPFKAEK